MSFLKKIGFVLLKGTEIITGLSPLLTGLIPGASAVAGKVVSELVQIGRIIVQVEAVGQALGLPGPDKLRAAAPQVASLIVQSDLMVGHRIHDAALFQRGTEKIADGMVDVLNALHEGGVTTESKVA